MREHTDARRLQCHELVLGSLEQFAQELFPFVGFVVVVPNGVAFLEAGQFGGACGNGLADIRGKRFAGLVVAPINLASDKAVRLVRDLPTNASASNPSPPIASSPSEGADTGAGTSGRSWTGPSAWAKETDLSPLGRASLSTKRSSKRRGGAAPTPAGPAAAAATATIACELEIVGPEAWR